MRDHFTDHRIAKHHSRHQFRGHPIISDQIGREGLSVVWNQLEETLRTDIPGAIVEFGCYAGTTSLFIRRALDERAQSDERPFHVYDSFEGLPAKSPQDRSAAGVDFDAGKLYVSKKGFLQQFQRARLRPPIIHKAWFADLRAADVPSRIAFAFLDSDFYDSISYSLRLVWPRLSSNGVILIDDYQRPALPGVERAVCDFFQARKPYTLWVERNIAIIRGPRYSV